MKFLTRNFSEATLQRNWFVLGFGTQFTRSQRDGQRVRGAPSVDLVLEREACIGWTVTTSKQVRLSAWCDQQHCWLRHQTLNRHSCRVTPGYNSRSSRIQSRSMMVKRNATLEPNTCHQQSHNADSICTRSATSHSAAGATREDPRPLRHEQGNDPRAGMYNFLRDARAKTMLNALHAPWGAVFSAIGEDEHAVAVVAEALPFTGRARVVILCDQEKPIKKLAELVRASRDTVLLNTLVSSRAIAEGIERGNQEVAKQCRTLRSRTVQLDMNHKIIPRLVRHTTWLIAHSRSRLTARRRANECAIVRTMGRSLSSPRQCTTRTLPRTLNVGVWLGKSHLMVTTPALAGRSGGAQERRDGWPGH